MIAWDLELLQKINQEWTNPFLDYLMPALSAIEAWIPLIVIAVLWTAWKGTAKARWMLLCLALTLGIGDGVVSKSLKESVGRVRPRDALDGVVIRDLDKAPVGFLRLFKPPVEKISEKRDDERGKSFPSSHVVNMFAAATVVLLFYRGLGMALLVLASLVAWSRVYCGAHWPTDIPPGAAIGVALAVLTVWAVGRARMRWVVRRTDAR